MPDLRTKQELATLARAFATTRNLVEYRANLYMPVDFDTALPGEGDPRKTVWTLLDHQTMRHIANHVLHILFASPAEEASFTLMVRQFADTVHRADGILVRWKNKRIKLLTSEGKLVEPTGEFVANYLNVPYHSRNESIEPLRSTLHEWLGGETQATSLLHHLATALQPGWSAVKYMLFIGEGRNGKGTLLKMINDLFGSGNISNVTRQDMAAKSPVTMELNGKLLNLVFDGPKEFLKDSSTEKTLIAGEPIAIRPLYENHSTMVQTNALFVEALNQEPRIGDKSPALQKRLVRFAFKNVYELDHMFEDRMRSPQMLAALLHLLLEHWVNKNETATKLLLTTESLDMQLSAVWDESPLLRFLEYLVTRDLATLKGLQESRVMVDAFLGAYRPWLGENGYKNLEDSYLLKQLQDHFTIDRKTVRIEGSPTTRRYIKAVSPDTANAINLLLAGGATTEDAKVLTD